MRHGGYDLSFASPWEPPIGCSRIEAVQVSAFSGGIATGLATIRITPALWHVVVLASNHAVSPPRSQLANVVEAMPDETPVPRAADRVCTAPLTLDCCCGRCLQTTANSDLSRRVGR